MGDGESSTPPEFSENSSAQGPDHSAHWLVPGTYYPILDLPILINTGPSEHVRQFQCSGIIYSFCMSALQCSNGCSRE